MAHHLRQGRALDEVEHDVHVIVTLDELPRSPDVGVLELAEDRALAFEAVFGSRTLSPLAIQDLHSDRLTVEGRAPHDAEATSAEALLESEASVEAEAGLQLVRH